MGWRPVRISCNEGLRHGEHGLQGGDAGEYVPCEIRTGTSREGEKQELSC